MSNPLIASGIQVLQIPPPQTVDILRQIQPVKLEPDLLNIERVNILCPAVHQYLTQ